MNSEFEAETPRPRNPDRADEPARCPPAVSEAKPGIITFTYDAPEAPRHFSFAHDRASGLYVVTHPDGTTERFRDNPVRHLVVEPDPQTGELRPAVKSGRPVYLYLCREHREG